MAKQDLQQKLKERLKTLEQVELGLFRSYNRHAQASVKLDILSRLQDVIKEQETLKDLT